jgi:N6-adenosine-specific RNA methylase IME4/DNA modification methylase
MLSIELGYMTLIRTGPFKGFQRNDYGAVLADPAWRFITHDKATAVTARGKKIHYRTMTLAEIMALPVRDLAAPDCVLILWINSPMLLAALDVIRAWGFRYQTFGFIWGKTTKDGGPAMGMGYWTRAGGEVALLATRGHPKRFDRGVRQLILEPRREHSRKPDRIYSDIERLVGDVPKIELFARQRRPHWDAWGDQVDKFAAHDQIRTQMAGGCRMTHPKKPIAVAITHKNFPSIPAAIKALGAMAKQLDNAKSFEDIRKVEQASEAFKKLFADVDEVKHVAEIVILDARARIGEALEKVQKAKTGPKQLHSPQGKQLGRAATGIPGTSRSRLKKLAALGKAKRHAVARELQKSGKDATVKAVLGELASEEFRAKCQAYEKSVKRSTATIVQASCLDWLPTQPKCDLLLTDPLYMTDLPDGVDIDTFANSWLLPALMKVKPTGRAYVCIGAYSKEVRAYLNIDPPPHLKEPEMTGWTYRNTIGRASKHGYNLNYCQILYYCGVEAPPLNCPKLVEQFAMHGAGSDDEAINAPDGRQSSGPLYKWHTWQKPDKLCERFVKQASKPGDLVLDPFAGTGSFIIAAANHGGCDARGCDIDPKMVKRAVDRGCRLVAAVDPGALADVIGQVARVHAENAAERTEEVREAG